MRAYPPPVVDEALWRDTLLSSDTETFLSAARNYLGPVKTPYDKREIVGRLASFFRRAEVRSAVVGLLDELDARILGCLFLLGPVTEPRLRSLFVGEMPLFDLGIRIANLFDRLLIFRFEAGGKRLVAVNPLLSEELGPAVLDPELLFGPPARCAAEPVGAPRATPAPGCDAREIAAFFIFLLHTPGAVRKDGSLTKRAAERAAALLPGQSPERLSALSRAFETAGFLGRGEDGRSPSVPAFGAALRSWGLSLPALLAVRLANYEERGGEVEAPDSDEAALFGGRVLAEALAAAPRGLVFSRGGLSRWLGMAAYRARRFASGESGAFAEPAALAAVGEDVALFDPPRLIPALEELGLAVSLDGKGEEEASSDRLVLAESRLASPVEPTESAEPAKPSPQGPILVAEGSHALHLLPEASLEERLFVGGLARPTSFGEVWSFEIDRESSRLAFAAGLDSGGIIERLEDLAGRPLPQSLSFSLNAWEEEYRSLRLYRGYVLVADERRRPVIESSSVLAPYIAERLAPGVYVLAVSGAEEAAELLTGAGLEAPPETRYGRSKGHAQARPEAVEDRFREQGSGLARALSPFRELAPRGARAQAESEAAARRLDPEPRIVELKKRLESMAESGSPADSVSRNAGQRQGQKPDASRRGPADVKELSERIERRLILTPEQLVSAEARPERIEASGLDYLGKVHIVERALRTSGDRLEVLYRLPGEDPVRALLRPVRLEKTEKGLVLEAENLGTGGPARVPLGAVSSVRRMRASLFGEDS
jgi:hypothetical protein